MQLMVVYTHWKLDVVFWLISTHLCMFGWSRIFLMNFMTKFLTIFLMNLFFEYNLFNHCELHNGSTFHLVFIKMSWNRSSLHLSKCTRCTRCTHARVCLLHVRMKEENACMYVFWVIILPLTLIGMRGDTFHSLSFLDQILSAEFKSISDFILRQKLISITHSAKIIESLKCT